MSGWRKRTIMEMAREADTKANLSEPYFINPETIAWLERFAALIRAEALAQPEQEFVDIAPQNQGEDYERGFVDGMQRQMRSSVDRAVNRMAQPEQEPVGKFAKFTDGIWREVTDGSAGVPLYTAPQRHWVGLTDDERINISYKANGNECVAVELTEAKLKEKNT